jgi:periplasmic divalent cation tolerance protein
MKEGHIVVLSTTSSVDEAARVGKTVVEEGLAACVNIIQGVRSIYVWKDKLCDEHEALSVYKTKTELFERLEARIKELHSYDVPEVIALTIDKGSREYLGWIDSVTGAKGR